MKLHKPRLKARLSALLSLVPESGFAADVGCDHGYIAASLLLSGRCREVLAADVRPGPLMRARETFEEYGITENVSFWQSDGLADEGFRKKIISLSEEKGYGALIIAGLGGMLMMRILREAEDVLPCFSHLILGPQSDIPKVRSFLSDNGFRIEEELLISEEGKYYPLIRAVPGKGSLNEEEAEFGPVLISKRDPVLYGWLLKRKALNGEILHFLASDPEKHSERIRELKEKACLIDRVLRTWDSGLTAEADQKNQKCKYEV